jgi:hypothetical protein
MQVVYGGYELNKQGLLPLYCCFRGCFLTPPPRQNSKAKVKKEAKTIRHSFCDHLYTTVLLKAMSWLPNLTPAQKRGLLLIPLPIILSLLKTSAPSRETVVKPNDERVVLLGASSGVGRDLAHAYAKRGAFM